jgi:hypothetical protein
MLLNVVAHNLSIQNIKVSKNERHKTYCVTKRFVTLTQCALYICNGIHYVTLYVMRRLRFENFTF